MPDAPKVTVTDPSRPGGPADVVVSGDEREPWRASRRQKALLAGAVVVALLVAAAVQVVRHQREQTRLDAQSLKQVAVVVTTGEDRDTGSTLVSLRNDGRGPVHVDALRIDLPGLSEIRLDKDLIEAQILPIAVPDRVTCSQRVLDTQREVSGQVSVRTTRGVRASLPVTLGFDAVGLLLARAQDRCHLYPLAGALQVTTGDARRVGRTLEVDLGLSNIGLRPLTVTGLTMPDGFTVRVDKAFPIAIPAAVYFGQDQRSLDDDPSLHLVIGVSDCATSAQAVTDTAFDPPGSIEVRNGNDQGSVGFQPSYEGAPLVRLRADLCG